MPRRERIWIFRDEVERDATGSSQGVQADDLGFVANVNQGRMYRWDTGTSSWTPAENPELPIIQNMLTAQTGVFIYDRVFSGLATLTGNPSGPPISAVTLWNNPDGDPNAMFGYTAEIRGAVWYEETPTGFTTPGTFVLPFTIRGSGGFSLDPVDEITGNATAAPLVNQAQAGAVFLRSVGQNIELAVKDGAPAGRNLFVMGTAKLIIIHGRFAT